MELCSFEQQVSHYLIGAEMKRQTPVGGGYLLSVLTKTKKKSYKKSRKCVWLTPTRAQRDDAVRQQAEGALQLDLARRHRSQRCVRVGDQRGDGEEGEVFVMLSRRAQLWARHLRGAPEADG